MHGLLVAGANRRVRWLGAAATVATLAVGGCATSGFERLPSLGVAELSGDEQLASISVNSHFFEPNRLIVQVGVRVRLVLVNDTLLAGHAFVVFAPEADLDINVYVPARQRVTVQFVPHEVGEFTFYCNIDDHTERGATGTLVVVAR